MNELNILTASFEKIKAYLEANKEEEQPVVSYKDPQELKQLIDFTVNKKAVSEHQFLELIDQYLDNSLKTANKQFLNQLYSGFNFPAFIGEIFSTLANTSMYTYEVAPVATVIETEMINLMNSYSGYPDGDGIFVTGGSNANLIAMFSARNRLFPEIRTDGIDRNMGLTAFVNEQAHYSFDTAANVLGIGARQVIKVKSDENGKMLASELVKEIKNSLKRNETPFFVAATCATTLLGAYDPIDELADICIKYNIWLHADGSFGGSVILSEQHRYLMKGLEKTDSFAWNPHKLMNIPLVCSALLVKKRGTLQNNITDINADYLFHDISPIEDLGKKSIQCGRSVDAVKLWFAWKYFGLEGYQQRTDNLIAMAKYAEETILKNDKLKLMVARQSFAVCFRYLAKNTKDLNSFNLQLRETLRIKGKSLVNYGYIGKDLTIRLIISNGELEPEDVDLFFENILTTGQALDNKK